MTSDETVMVSELPSKATTQTGRLIRRLYVERFSEERVKKAIRLAASHRTRAGRIGRLDHFSAWEWLDLCAGFEFCCSVCREPTSLVAHHVKELSYGGPNSIDNIQPLCLYCHRYMHGGCTDLSAPWWADQDALMRSFWGGQTVRRIGSPRGRRGLLIRTIPPERGPLPLRGFLSSSVRFIIPITKFSVGWVKAKACVRWARSGVFYQKEEYLEGLAAVEIP